MTGITNIDELIQLLNTSDTILRSNSEIEYNVRQHNGTIVYSFNNIIIASEVSEALYNELLKDPYVQYIQDLPLKKYGEIDISLINQLDPTKIYLNDYLGDYTDGISGNTSQNNIQNIKNNISIDSGISTSPTIENTNLTLSALTNQWFEYTVIISGSIPINLQYIPINYTGELQLKYNNVLSGKTSIPGIYEITIRATNNYGFDMKTLTLTILEPIKITNTNLTVYSKLGSQFNYTIFTNGTPPITYYVNNMPPNLTLDSNTGIISGVFSTGSTGATYNMIIVASGLTNVDSKNLTVITGTPPIITSSGEIICQQYSALTYIITSTGLPATYNVLGIMPDGLQFKNDTISGMPIYDGINNLKIKATNAFGDSIKDLKIFVNYMGT